MDRLNVVVRRKLSVLKLAQVQGVCSLDFQTGLLANDQAVVIGMGKRQIVPEDGVVLPPYLLSGGLHKPLGHIIFQVVAQPDGLFPGNVLRNDLAGLFHPKGVCGFVWVQPQDGGGIGTADGLCPYLPPLFFIGGVDLVNHPSKPPIRSSVSRRNLSAAHFGQNNAPSISQV